MAIDYYAQKHKRNSAAKTEKYRRDRQRAKLKLQLLAEHPFCAACGVQLQCADPQADNYASVVWASRRLSCPACVSLVNRMPVSDTPAPEPVKLKPLPPAFAVAIAEVRARNGIVTG